MKNKRNLDNSFIASVCFTHGMSGRRGKMDIENVSAFRRRILSTSVRSMPGNSVAEFAVTGVAFLWHQVWAFALNLLGGTWGLGVEGDTESGIFNEVV